MTLTNNGLRFTPYLFEPESESKSWVFSVGEVSTYGVPMQGVSVSGLDLDTAFEGIEIEGEPDFSLKSLSHGQGVERLMTLPVRRFTQLS